MKMENLPSTDASEVPDACATVAIESASIAGLIADVASRSEDLRQQHASLNDIVAGLVDSQKLVSDSSASARTASEQAIEKLAVGEGVIRSSLDEISSLIDLVVMLGNHLASLDTAVDNVQASSRDIAQIAETTSILAFNAAIEAQRRSGEANEFGKVADEIKQLSDETRAANAEIQSTVSNLSARGQEVIAQIATGHAASEAAKRSVQSIDNTLTSVSSIIGQVNEQNAQITQSTGKIDERVERVRRETGEFEQFGVAIQESLSDARSTMTSLEMEANTMFDRVVKGGLSQQDSEIVALAKAYAGKIAQTAEDALESGDLSRDAFFDNDYREIPGSNPKRYTTRLTEWADRNWRPLLDSGKAVGRPVKMFAVSDRNGFLPTHTTERSQAPTGDVVHDTLYCRNGRILLDDVDKRAKAASDEFTMAVSRQEGDGSHYYVVRRVFVPLVIDGERWGDLEVAYITDDEAWKNVT